jgi:DNA repair ATPase RecN
MESKNPPYYKKTIETCDAILSQLNNDSEKIGFLKGQAMKYLCRFGSKMGGSLAGLIVDCEKANWYINKLYMFLKKLEKSNDDMSQVLDELEKQIKNMDDKNKKHKNNITKLFNKDKDE